MLAIAGKVLGGPGMESGLTWTEVASRLGEDEEELRKVIQGETEVEPVGGKLKIWTRARHVVSWACLRVKNKIELTLTVTSCSSRKRYEFINSLISSLLRLNPLLHLPTYLHRNPPYF